MKTWYMIIDVAKCENCNNCFLSCKDEHTGNDWPGIAVSQPDQGPSWIKIDGKERGQFPLIDVAYLPSPCMHCDNAPCMKAAENGAVRKRPDGIVIIDPVKSKGQKKIVQACPYGAIQWNEALQVPQKCTFCAHLLDDGWEKSRCVQSCPTGALSMYRLSETEMKKRIESEKLEVLHPGFKTYPRVYYKNLYRFNRCFIAGSVAIKKDGREECAEGAKVTLLNASGGTLDERIADHYGDFKFDNLEENKGNYKLRIVYPGYDTKTVEVNLKTSLNAGTFFL